MLFLLLLALGVAIAGLTAYVMTWPLVTTHLRDRHPDRRAALGASPFSPGGFAWFLGFAWRGSGDNDLGFLAFPGSIAAWAIALGGSAALIVLVLRASGAVS